MKPVEGSEQLTRFFFIPCRNKAELVNTLDIGMTVKDIGQFCWKKRNHRGLIHASRVTFGLSLYAIDY